MAKIGRTATAEHRARRNLTLTNSCNLNGSRTGKMTEGMFLWEVTEKAECFGNKGFVACLKGVLQNQPKGWDPHEPPTNFCDNLQAAVYDALELDPDQVGLYTAVGSALDYEYGTDCFLLISFPDTIGKVLVSLDISERWKDRYKADLLVVADNKKPKELAITIGKKVVRIANSKKERRQFITL